MKSLVIEKSKMGLDEEPELLVKGELRLHDDCQTAPNVNIVSQSVARQQLNAYSHSPDDYLKD